MKQSHSLILYIVILNLTVAFPSCTRTNEKKDDCVVLHLAKVNDIWRYNNQLSDERFSFERDIYLDTYIKNDRQLDVFVPIHDNTSLSVDTNYQSRLILSIDGHEIDCEIGVDRNWTISSVPNAIYLRQYQVDDSRHPQIIREKQLYSGDLNRKIYTGDSVAVFIHINKRQLHEAGINEAMDVHEIIKKMQLRYEKNLEDLKFDDLHISDIYFDIEKPIVKIDRRIKNEMK